MKTFCRISYRVPFSETDAMGIVHHANHPKYLERGRVEFLRLTDFSYASVVKMGFHFPVTELKVAYKKPLAFDDIVIVETAISQLTRTRLNFSYRLFTGPDLFAPLLTNEALSGNPLVTGETFHCCVNNEGRPVEMRADLLAALEKLAGGAA